GAADRHGYRHRQVFQLRGAEIPHRQGAHAATQPVSDVVRAIPGNQSNSRKSVKRFSWEKRASLSLWDCARKETDRAFRGFREMANPSVAGRTGVRVRRA